MGSASENGHEVVVGTAVMRIGENSRTVSTGVAERLTQIGRSLPVDVVVKPVMNRTELVNSTIATVARNLAEGAVLVIVVLFALLGNFRAALIAAFVIPITMLLTSIGMLEAGVSANLMSLGALDFGLIVDGAVIIVENALRRLAEAQHNREGELTMQQRLGLVAASAREMIRPSVYGQAIIILVYAPLLTFTGVEGKMFEPMALTVIIALVFAFILSLTFVPAAIAIWLSKRVEEKESRVVAFLRQRYEPGLDAAMRRPSLTIGVAIGALALAGVAFTTLGKSSCPSSMRQRPRAGSPHPRHVGRPEPGHAVPGRKGARQGAGGSVRFLAHRHVGDRVRSDAGERDRHVRHPETQEGMAGPRFVQGGAGRAAGKASLTLPGNAYEITQPIQMRFNELIAGVRGDIAIKVFGDDFGEMNATADRIAASCAKRAARQTCGSSRPRGCRCSISAPTAPPCRGSG